MLPESSRLLITGANGHLGQRLIAALARGRGVTAVVRSHAARRVVENRIDLACSTCVELDYRDATTLTQAAQRCDAAVHLVGILKETAANRYVDAHERAMQALVAAARTQRLRRIVYVSILGSDAASTNPALASRGRTEQMLLDSGIDVLILRVPMVLGEGDYAAAALSRRARSRVALLARGASLEQPIYAGDVVAAMLAGIDAAPGVNGVLELAGPESLPRAALVRRAGAVLGNLPRCISIPLAPLLAASWLAQRLMPNPPVTPAMLRVLDYDDNIDPHPAATKLGIRLTPLDEMLRRCVR
jgi:NADH dehydrogenase